MDSSGAMTSQKIIAQISSGQIANRISSFNQDVVHYYDVVAFMIGTMLRGNYVCLLKT